MLPTRYFHSLCVRVAVALLTTFAILGFASQSFAQTPSLDAFYTRLDPKESFKYTWKGQSQVYNVGAFQWEVPQSVFSTGGLDRSFSGFCAEVLVPMQSGKSYRFKHMKLDSLPVPFAADPAPQPEDAAHVGARRATLIRELFGRHYAKHLTPEDTFAFQVALWELTQETEPGKDPVKFDVFAGDFQADYTKDTAPAFVTKAQEWLDGLKGDDQPFYTNPALDGRELILLQGIPNAEGEVAQSQFALRYVDGGATGAGFGLNNGAGGGSGAGCCGGAGGGGSGGGTGSGGGSTGGGGIFTGGSPGTGDGGGGNGGGNGDGGGNGGGNGNGGRPPVNPPPVNTPVPAPAGLVLGLVAVGALATRRIYGRLTKRARG
jgi:hypothetical protein